MSDKVPTPVGATSDSWNQEKEKLGYHVAQPMREHGNYTIGVLLTAVEAALGDTVQAKALKNLVRREMYLLIDRNQSEVYERLGIQKMGLKPVEMYVEDDEE
jgi:hypothetical protein